MNPFADPVTAPGTIDALARGQTCDLEGPGWSDTGRGPCPDCNKVTGFFKSRPDVRFYYGVDVTRPHRCGQDVAFNDQGQHARVRRLQAQQRTMSALAEREPVTSIFDLKGNR